METSASEPLAIIAEARAAAADRLHTPWWYHPAVGLLFAGHVVATSLGGAYIAAASTALFCAGCAALMTAYRRLTGVWISSFQAGQASRWAGALAVFLLVVAGGAFVIALETDLTWPVWFLAAVAFAGTVVLGRRFDTEVRAQLRAGR